MVKDPHHYKYYQFHMEIESRNADEANMASTIFVLVQKILNLPLTISVAVI
jgi:hypothetical protein